MTHIGLPGDSVFDNAVYSAPEPGGRKIAEWIEGGS